MARTIRVLAERTPESRERSADMWRAVAICLVVLGHWFVVAVTYTHGELSGYNALDVIGWLDPVTWVFQVMPVFFLVGGYASGASYASHRASGGDGFGWILKRTDRLLRPTTALLVALPVATLIATAGGAERRLVDTAIWLSSLPLWFLVAYLALVILTPWLFALHRRAGRAGLAVPVVLVAFVGVADLARMGLHVPAVGQSSYLFAWLAVYQAGFCWRDGLLRLSPGRAAALAVGGLAAVVLLTVPGPYSLGMVGDNATPPTLALMALAVTQTGVVLALRPAASRWLRRVRPWSAVIAGNSVILTVFLWHMTAAAVAALVLVPTGIMAQPGIGSGAWLAWRVPWLFFCAVFLAVLVAVFAPIELRRPALRHLGRAGGPVRNAATGLGVAAALAGLLLIARAGPGNHGPLGLPWDGVAAYLCGAAVLRAARGQRPGRERRPLA